jgi:hypothetical protein
MSDFKKGMLVQHTTLGLGKIVALDQKAVHVFFAQSHDPFATKLRLQVAEPFLSPSPRNDRWLSGLSRFAFDEKSARYRLSDPWMSDGDATSRFLEVFPKGFEDEKYIGGGKGARERSPRWRRAHELFVETLGGGEGERLLAAGELTTLVERALEVERQVRPLLAPAEKSLLGDALADPEAARGYFEALFALLALDTPDEARFEALASAVSALPPGGSRESAWPVVTLLPFVAQPDRHMIVRPKLTCEAAQRLRLELDYQQEPQWSTYAALLEASAGLLEKLRPLGARDHVDVEGFMHVVGGKAPRRKALVAAE